MFRNYLLVAWRGLRKNKLYTSINVIGLTAGIVSCLLIGLYVWNELSYDRFNKKADRIVRLVMEYTDGGAVNRTAVCGTKAGPQLSRTFPAIAAFTRTIKLSGVVSYKDKVFDEPGLLYADSGFFSIFSFPLLEGDPRAILNAPNQVVLTRKLAGKYFGQEDPVGRVLNIGRVGNCIVTGVTQDPPGNSQVQFDLVVSFVSLAQSRTEDWWSANYPTYLLLQAPGQVAGLREDISGYMKGVSRNLNNLQGNDYLTYRLEPLLDVHLHSSVGGGLEPGGNIIYVLVLSTIALMILLIACVNYTNLATAQSAGRGPEVAVRKVLGARAGQLFGQFMGESVMLTAVSLILATVITELSLPAFSSLTGKTFTPGMLLNPVPVTGVILLGALISFLAGGYPAFVLSNSAVIRMLKSGFRVTSAGNNLRKSLIVLQFVISIFLIISTIIVFQQLSYIRGKDLGYDKDHVLLLPVDAKMHEHYTALKDALRLDPDILNVSGGYDAPTDIEWADGISGDNGHGKINLSVSAAPVDLDFISTMGMTLLAGRDFVNSDFGRMDTTDNDANFRNSFIVNEQVIKAFGWTPAQAIGKTITKGSPGTIVGVVKDFHFASLHEPIGKMVIFLDTGEIRTLLVKISGKNIPGTLAYMQQVWKDRISHRPFEYNFLDETYAAMYKTEQRGGRLFGLFAGLAILLACLGLFALAAYTTVQRAKEIGIRKVLGATLSDITLLVSADFIRLVLISIVIASPVAWYLSQRWLADFAYRITVSWWVFALAGCVSVAIAFITVGYQALRAATANPVKSLRTE